MRVQRTYSTQNGPFSPIPQFIFCVFMALCGMQWDMTAALLVAGVQHHHNIHHTTHSYIVFCVCVCAMNEVLQFCIFGFALRWGKQQKKNGAVNLGALQSLAVNHMANSKFFVIAFSIFDGFFWRSVWPLF